MNFTPHLVVAALALCLGSQAVAQAAKTAPEPGKAASTAASKATSSSAGPAATASVDCAAQTNIKGAPGTVSKGSVGGAGVTVGPCPVPRIPEGKALVKP